MLRTQQHVSKGGAAAVGAEGGFSGRTDSRGDTVQVAEAATRGLEHGGNSADKVAAGLERADSDFEKSVKRGGKSHCRLVLSNCHPGKSQPSTSRAKPSASKKSPIP